MATAREPIEQAGYISATSEIPQSLSCKPQPVHTSGQVISGVIGDKKKTFDLWGNTVNLASRLESSGLAGGIQITESTFWRLRDRTGFERVDDVEVRGIGRINVYTYDPGAEVA